MQKTVSKNGSYRCTAAQEASAASTICVDRGTSLPQSALISSSIAVMDALFHSFGSVMSYAIRVPIE